ncbi:MAG: SUMF1/EgtB/PvdO family nonheme iron enzyme [Myxococcota bacterium]
MHTAELHVLCSLSHTVVVGLGLLFIASSASCQVPSTSEPAPHRGPAQTPVDAAATPVAALEESNPPARTDEEENVAPSTQSAQPSEEAKAAPCPEGMVYVDVDHCDRIEQACIRQGQYNREGFYRICREFARERRCVGDMRALRFCIDRYEYPNRKGAHPPAVINAWDAAALCRSEGKRLCWSREWTAACEGRNPTPFPQGYERAADSSLCRNDLPQDQPTRLIWSSRPRVLDAELRRLDGSVPAGSMAGCVTDLGVYDMTGNFSEWVFIEEPHRRVTWAGTKGGWWGQVRNNCRSTGTGHPERFRYFPLSTRCCADANSTARQAPLEPGRPPLWTPPPQPAASQRNPKPLWRGWSPDYPRFSRYNNTHGKVRARYMKRHHPLWNDPLDQDPGLDKPTRPAP